MKPRNLALVAGIIFFLPLQVLGDSRAGPRMKEYVTDAFLPHLWNGTKATFTKPENLIRLGAGAALAALAHQYDEEVRNRFEDHRMGSDLSDLGNNWGSGEIPAAISLAMMFSGWHSGNDGIADAGEALGEALIIQGIVINAIKPIANKERPNGSNNLAFPSGHTGAAFATAAVLHDRFGWEVGVPAYSLAVITGMARMDVEAHWISDVVMGAAIAMVTGYAVSGHHDDYPYDVRRKKPAMTLSPMIGPDRQGIMVIATW